jgi:hypothetical protein
LTNFVGGLLKDLPAIESSKRLLSILRVVNQVLQCFGRDLPAPFFATISEAIQAVFSSGSAAVSIEIASILTRLSPLSAPFFLPLCESFDKSSQRLALFVVPQTIAATKHALQSARIRGPALVDQFSCIIPSQNLRFLRALEILVTSHSQFPTVQPLMPHILRLFEAYAASPFFDEALSSLASSMAKCDDFAAIRTFFVQRIFPLLLHAPNSPQFRALSAAIPAVAHAVPPPIRAYADFAAAVPAQRPPHPRAAQFFGAFAQWSIRAEFDAARALAVALERLDVAQRLFAAAPSAENARELADAAAAKCAGFDAGAVAARVTAIRVPELAALVLVRALARSPAGRAAAEAWAVAVPALADGITRVLAGRAVEALEAIEAADA